MLGGDQILDRNSHRLVISDLVIRLPRRPRAADDFRDVGGLVAANDAFAERDDEIAGVVETIGAAGRHELGTALDGFAVDLAHGVLIGADRGDEGAWPQPGARDHGVFRRRGRDHDIGIANGVFTRLNQPDVLGDAAAGGRHARDEFVAARGASGREEYGLQVEYLGERFQLIAGHPAGADDGQDLAVLAPEIARRESCSGAGSQIGQIAGFEHGMGMAGFAVEQANQTAHADDAALVVLIEIGNDLDAVPFALAQKARVEYGYAARRFGCRPASQPLDGAALRQQREGFALDIDRRSHIVDATAVGLGQDAKLPYRRS